jgi:uncharacterized protein (DUF1778 family)
MKKVLIVAAVAGAFTVAMVAAITRAAIHVLNDPLDDEDFDDIQWEEEIVLTDEQFQAFMELLDEPAREVPGLEELLSNPTAFDINEYGVKGWDF